MNRLAALGIGAAIVALWCVNPDTASWLPHCPLHAWTGLCCPGCGSTRALHQLLHGHVLAALRLNPIAVSAVPWVAALIFHHRRPPVPANWALALLVAVLAFGVLRNLPWYPWTLLSPEL